MKKETLLEIILGTIGGLVFAVGLTMCLIPEWDLFKAGVVVGVVGFIILLCIIPVYHSSHPKKTLEKINWGIVLAWLIEIIGALVMGFGMSKVMVGDPSRNDFLLGIGTGVIGLIICVLVYPVYAYLKNSK